MEEDEGDGDDDDDDGDGDGDEAAPGDEAAASVRAAAPMRLFLRRGSLAGKQCAALLFKAAPKVSPVEDAEGEGAPGGARWARSARGRLEGGGRASRRRRGTVFGGRRPTVFGGGARFWERRRVTTMVDARESDAVVLAAHAREARGDFGGLFGRVARCAWEPEDLTLGASSYGRACWDCVLVAAVLYEAVATPIELSFLRGTRRSASLAALRRAATAVFVSDILVNLRTGYYRGEREIRDGWLIARRYVASYRFVLDQGRKRALQRGSSRSDFLRGTHGTLCVRPAR